MTCHYKQFSSDPAPKTDKYCYYFEGDTLHQCGHEHHDDDACFFGGTKRIYFGFLTSKTEKDGVVCSDDVFGNPVKGVKKDCYVRSNELDSTEMAELA